MFTVKYVRRTVRRDGEILIGDTNTARDIARAAYGRKPGASRAFENYRLIRLGRRRVRNRMAEILDIGGHT